MSNSSDKLNKALESFNTIIKNDNIQEATCEITWTSIDVGIDVIDLLPLPKVNLSFKKFDKLKE